MTFTSVILALWAGEFGPLAFESCSSPTVCFLRIYRFAILSLPWRTSWLCIHGITALCFGGFMSHSSDIIHISLSFWLAVTQTPTTLCIPIQLFIRKWWDWRQNECCSLFSLGATGWFSDFILSARSVRLPAKCQMCLSQQFPAKNTWFIHATAKQRQVHVEIYPLA